MAWRPSEYLEAGELDNTTPCKIKGWMKFTGLDEKITFDLEGDFHRDIRGSKIRFIGDALDEVNKEEAKEYMKGIAINQTGKAGDITAGLPPTDYVKYPYIEWYSDQNGRVVVELDENQIEIIGMPIPAIESDPISSEEQKDNMNNFLNDIFGTE